MQHFIISGKAKNVFPLIALKAKREKELDLMMKRGKFQDEDKTGVLPLEKLLIQFPSELQPHEQAAHLCWTNPTVFCNVFDHHCCAEIDCEFL